MRRITMDPEMNTSISSIRSQEILDSRGNPTVEATVLLDCGITGTASVPSGASTGIHESQELRDNDPKRYKGKGVLHVVEKSIPAIETLLKGMSVNDQRAIDRNMIELDGTPEKKVLGANAILAVSLACARAGAIASDIPLYTYLRKIYWPDVAGWILPVPQMNVLNGGKHAPGSVDMQEFMIMPVKAPSFVEALRMGSQTYHALKSLLLEKKLPVGVGDEGGFMPKVPSHEEMLTVLVDAIRLAGYEPGNDIVIGLDPAASEFFENGAYMLKTENATLTSSELIAHYQSWTEKFPVVSIEDGLSEDDWDGFVDMMKKMGDRVQIVGDDLFVTHPDRLTKGIELHAANAILVKLNQIGTLSETADVISQARQAGLKTIISHRSGETEDAFIADLAVACNAGQIKSGAPCRIERVAKYNRLLHIERELQSSSQFATFSFLR